MKSSYELSASVSIDDQKCSPRPRASSKCSGSPRARRKALVAARQSSEKLLHSSAFRRTTSRIRRRACTPHRRRGFSAPHRLSPWVWTHSAPSRDHSTLEPGQRLRCLAGYPERQVQSIAYHNVEAGSVWQVGYVIPEAVVLQD